MTPRNLKRFTQCGQQGFSFVEIMVGMAIALISTLIVMQVFATFEGQKRTTTGGADAQTNGAIALFTIERDLRMAGYGFNSANALGCKVNRAFNGTSITPLTLAPVLISNATSGDVITITASNKTGWSVPATITTDHPPTATNFFLNSTLGMTPGDLVIAFEPNKDCTLLEITGIPSGTIQIHHQSTSPWNPPGGQNIFPQPDGYRSGAMLINLGSIENRSYQLNSSLSLVFSEYDSSTNTSAEKLVAPDIVNLQAQYGFDTRAGAQTNIQVDTWADEMIDADGSAVSGDTGDITRIYAVRFAVLARNGNMEKPLADGSCNITTTVPTWAGGSFAMAPIPGWQCYRYKVFETVVPLRNMIWKQ
jgi:type IV pilus assembly protein PilW